MKKSLVLDVGLAAKLKGAFARSGWTAEMIDAACEGDTLGQFRQVLEGIAVVVQSDDVIDTDASPYNPWREDGGSIEDHRGQGLVKWNPKEVECWASIAQQETGGVTGELLYKELTGKSLLNANVLDFLLRNQSLIPKEWKDGRYVYFWGTLYWFEGHLRVRSLYWDRGQWHWYFRWLEDSWRGRSVAATCKT